ncbi:MAG: signal peptidase II [Cellulomonadaceae bacterium]|nr:signal peptidase II [Cellulomonadaceae bacterium]
MDPVEPTQEAWPVERSLDQPGSFANPPVAVADAPVVVDSVPGSFEATQNTKRHRRLIITTFAIAAATILADQLTKGWALTALADGHRVELLGEYLSLWLLRNPGAALGIGDGFTWVLTIVVVALVAAMFWVIPRIRSLGWAWAFGLLLGGAIGNLIDRLFRYPGFAHGKVIDFIAYWNWFVGNVADIAIVIAAGLIILLTFRGIHIDGTRDSDKAKPSP